MPRWTRWRGEDGRPKSDHSHHPAARHHLASSLLRAPWWPCCSQSPPDPGHRQPGGSVPGLVADGRLPREPLPVLRQDELGEADRLYQRMCQHQLRQLVGRRSRGSGAGGRGRSRGGLTTMPSWTIWPARINCSGCSCGRHRGRCQSGTRDVAGNIADAAGAARQTEQQAREGSRPSPAWGPPWRRLVP